MTSLFYARRGPAAQLPELSRLMQMNQAFAAQQQGRAAGGAASQQQQQQQAAGVSPQAGGVGMSGGAPPSINPFTTKPGGGMTVPNAFTTPSGGMNANLGAAMNYLNQKRK